MDHTLLTTRKQPQSAQYAGAMTRSALMQGGIGSDAEFAKWLNQHSHAARQISEILALVCKAVTLARDAKRRDAFNSGSKAHDDFMKIVEEVNRRLARYTGRMTWFSLFWPQDDSLLQRIRKEKGCLRLTDEEMERVFLPPEPITRFERADAAIPPDEWNGFLKLLDLIRERQIDHFRRCEYCAAWMFVRVPYGDRAQRFCPGGECLREWRKNSPKYRDQQKMYMRELRENEKQRSLGGKHAKRQR